jgi:hypothetical protein
MGARFYDPYLTRWISADTIVPDLSEPQDFNRYSYVRNSPLGYTDPSGHCLTPFCIGEIVIAAVGALLLTSCDSPQMAPPLDSTVRYEVSWDDSNGNHVQSGGLMTSVGNNLWLSHDHFSAPPCNATNLSTDYFDHNGQLIATDAAHPSDYFTFNGGETSLLDLPFLPDNPVPVASQQTIDGIAPGDTLTAVYWDDATQNSDYSEFNLSFVDPNNGSLNVNDLQLAINPGDSGGPVYYNGQLVANLYNIWINPPGGATAFPIPQNLPVQRVR